VLASPLIERVSFERFDTARESPQDALGFVAAWGDERAEHAGTRDRERIAISAGPKRRRNGEGIHQPIERCLYWPQRLQTRGRAGVAQYSPIARHA
jgi:hypothetical protein